MTTTYWAIAACFVLLLLCCLAFFMIRSEIKYHRMQTAIIGILNLEWMDVQDLRQKLAEQQIGMETEDLIRFMERLKDAGFIDIGPLFVLPEHQTPGQKKYRLTHLPR